MKVISTVIFLLSRRVSSMAISRYASSRNKEPITDVLTKVVADIPRTNNDNPFIQVLEVASGTGEHCAYFCEKIPSLIIQPTEPDVEMHSSIQAWSSNHKDRVKPPLSLNVLEYLNAEPFQEPMSSQEYDLIICINMIHISPFETTSALFNICQRCLRKLGMIYLYGPFRENGFMVDSNVAFDQSLRDRNAAWGVRDLEAVDGVARSHGFHLYRKYEMPANNLSVIFQKLDHL